MDISIVIPTFNNVERLSIMLKSLYLQYYNEGNLDIIIVNDGSNESEEAFIRKLKNIYNFRYFCIDRHGRSYARNCGIENARYNFVLFLDDDVILSPNCLFIHAKEQMDKPQILHGEIKHFVYSCLFKDPIQGIPYESEKILKTNNCIDFFRRKCKILNTPEKYEEIYKVSMYLALENKIKEIFEQNDNDYKWIAFTGGNVSCPKKWLEEVNGFDEMFGIRWGCEDLELGYRLNKIGKPFGYSCKASVCHMNHKKNNAITEHGISADYFMNKHNDCAIRKIINFLNRNIK